MNNMVNIKDKITNWCAYATVAIGALQATKTQGVVFPHWVDTISIIIVALCIATVGFMTGKTPDGSVKTDSQVMSQNPIKP
jgi:hypothetical protein